MKVVTGKALMAPFTRSITDRARRFPKLSTPTTSANLVHTFQERRLLARTHPVPPCTLKKSPALSQLYGTTPMLVTRILRTTRMTTLGQRNSLRTSILIDVSTPFTGTGVMTTLRFPTATTRPDLTCPTSASWHHPCVNTVPPRT
jgi:hypothetical protein